MSSGKNTQLTTVQDYDVNQLTFTDVQECAIPGDTQGLTYKRINVGTRYKDGTCGDLIIKTPKCFSFGVSPNINGKTGMVDGYSFPICLYSKEGKTPEEDAFVKKLEEIIESTKDYLVQDKVKEDMGKYDLIRPDLRKLNPIYRKKDKKGKILEEFGPVLYPKVIINKKTGAVLSAFYEENEFDKAGEPLEINFDELVTNKDQKNYCHATSAIKIESVYIGLNISLQVKLFEADIERFDTKPQKLLRTSRPVVNKPKNVIINEVEDDIKHVAPKKVVDDDLLSTDDEDGNDNATGNIVASSSDDEPGDPAPPQQVIKKKVIKKKVLVKKQ
jgi:hypothetical protein